MAADLLCSSRFRADPVHAVPSKPTEIFDFETAAVYPFGLFETKTIHHPGRIAMYFSITPYFRPVTLLTYCKLDGSYQSCLAEFGPNQQLPGDIETDYYTDGSFLYFVLNDVDPETTKRSGSVVSVSLQSGEVKTVYESPEAVTQLKIFTAFDCSLVLYEVQAKNLSEVSERFFVRNIDTGEEQEINWRSDDTAATMANGRYLWTVDETAQTLIRYDMAANDRRQYSLAALCSQVQQQYGDILDIYVSPTPALWSSVYLIRMAIGIRFFTHFNFPTALSPRFLFT